MKMSNRFYTILIVPEKSSQVRRLILPSWLVKGASAALAFIVLLASAMVFDYWYVMSQIGENKQLKLENRRLRQQVQVFQNKITTVESTMERVKTFATRLKVIMHVEDQSPNLQGKFPDSNATQQTAGNSTPGNPNLNLGDSGPNASSADPEQKELYKEYLALENRISKVSLDALETEEQLQDEYEILYDKKAFLAALPTRQPAPGYFTSGFGIRTSPIGDRIKMHEGLDIANRLGTAIRAPADGEVTFADSKAGYGLTVILNHGYGIETWYGHLKHFIVKKGESVKRGTKIAHLGNSGRSTGPHVHYEVRVHGYPVDPRSYIFEDSSP
jgi:murein DD-endopeptidase MepM/ murein hydrolase activator NlpD